MAADLNLKDIRMGKRAYLGATVVECATCALEAICEVSVPFLRFMLSTKRFLLSAFRVSGSNRCKCEFGNFHFKVMHTDY